MAPLWIHIYFILCGHVILFSSPSFTVSTLIFRITTLTILYDSDDYVIHACISPCSQPRYRQPAVGHANHNPCNTPLSLPV
ncbi:hypothetical protein V8E52_006977 [Russula decolorans]